MEVTALRDPGDDGLRQRIRRWTRECDPAGYRFVPGRYGWYRQDDLPFGVATLDNRVSPVELPAALAECRSHFPSGPLTLWVEGRRRNDTLGDSLLNAGASAVFDASYLAHDVGAHQPQPLPEGIELREGGEAELATFVRVKQQAFMSTEHQPSAEGQRREHARRLAELRRNGGFLLACRDGEVVGGVSYLTTGRDRFLNLLVTRVPYRRQGIGRALVDALLSRSYGEGVESVVVVPEPSVAKLYRQAGFTNEVLWRRAYQLA